MERAHVAPSQPGKSSKLRLTRSVSPLAPSGRRPGRSFAISIASPTAPTFFGGFSFSSQVPPQRFAPPELAARCPRQCSRLQHPHRVRTVCPWPPTTAARTRSTTAVSSASGPARSARMSSASSSLSSGVKPSATAHPTRTPSTDWRHSSKACGAWLAPRMMTRSFARPVRYSSAAGHEAEVSRVQPAVRAERSRRGLGIAVVAGHHRGPSRRHSPYPPLGQHEPLLIPDVHLDTRHRAPHGHQRPRALHHPSLPRRALPPPRTASATPPRRWEGDGQRGLGQPIHRSERARREAEALEAVDRSGAASPATRARRR